MFSLEKDEIQFFLQITSMLLTMSLALFAYKAWAHQQKLLRESQAAQSAIQAQIALRLKIYTSSQIILNSILVYDEQDKSKIIHIVSNYRESMEEKYIDLIQKLSVCQMLWDKSIDNIIIEYETSYNDLQTIISTLHTDKILKGGSIDSERNTINNIINKMIELENNSSVIKEHLI